MPVNLNRLPIAQQLAIKALLESGKSERFTAKITKNSRETVRAVNKCQTLDPQLVDRIKSGLAAQFYGVVDRSLQSITDDKLKASTAQQLMMVAAIGTDKARLIDGKVTARTEYVNASDKEINDEIARLEGELGKWESGEVVNAEGNEPEHTTPAGQHASETVDPVPQGAD